MKAILKEGLSTLSHTLSSTLSNAKAEFQATKCSIKCPTKWAAAVLLLLAGCQHPGPRFDPHAKFTMPAVTLETVVQTNRVNPDWLKPPPELFTLGPGDKLEIELLDDPTSKTVTTVGPDGKIYFQLLPGIDVWGLTLAEAKAAIEKEMANFVRDRVQLGLTLKAVESRRVWVLGRVQA